MKSRVIGSSGLEVSCIGLGGMPLSISGRPDHERAVATIKAAVDAGVTLIDTADVYCIDDDDIGHNERLIGKALASIGATGVTVATKGGLERPGGAWTTNGRPEHLKAACDNSLAALGVEVIELYQLHAPDDDVPLADSVGALAELKSAGKIRHVGLSNVSVDEIETARAIVPIVSVQNRCNLFDTTSFDNGVVAHCHREGIAFLPHSPVGGHRAHTRLADSADLVALAGDTGASTYELALAYLLSLTPVMIPIPGASKPSSIESSARAGELELAPETLAKIAKIFPNATLG